MAFLHVLFRFRNRIKSSGIKEITLAVVFLICTPTFGQIITKTETESEYIRGTYTVNTDIHMVGTIDQQYNVVIELEPVFKDKNTVITTNQANTKYHVSYVLEPDGIGFEPTGSYRLEDPLDKPKEFVTKEIFQFKPVNNLSVTDSVLFTFNLTLKQGWDSKKTAVDMWINIPIAKEEPEEPVSEVQADEQEETPAATPVNLEVSETPESNQQSISQQRPAQQNSPRQTNTTGQQNEIKGLKEILTEAQTVYENVYSMKLEKDEVPVNTTELQQYGIQMNQLKSDFSAKYAGLTSAAPQADRIKQLFDDYANTTQRMIDEMTAELNQAAYTQQNQAGGLEKSQTDQTQHSGKDDDMLLKYIIIGLAALIVILAVVFIVMNAKKKKDKTDFQKQMHRKAQSELNKQKFQASSQKNKLKI